MSEIEGFLSQMAWGQTTEYPGARDSRMDLILHTRILQGGVSTPGGEEENALRCEETSKLQWVFIFNLKN